MTEDFEKWGKGIPDMYMSQYAHKKTGQKQQGQLVMASP